LNIEEITKQVIRYKQEGKKLFTTSSFQTHSIVLLHILSRIDPEIPVYFINTGFHFSETIEFKDHVAELLGIKVLSLQSSTPKNLQKQADGKFLFTSDPDYCCFLNKVEPMNGILMAYDIWINGVRGDQSDVRKGFLPEEPTRFNAIRFHPLLDWDNRRIHAYRKEYSLPANPLESKGYLSIGCEPCTRKFDPEFQERQARWFGLKKTECGLNTELIKS
jgi:phosphoadenosine phosphosulfate reductase